MRSKLLLLLAAVYLPSLTVAFHTPPLSNVNSRFLSDATKHPSFQFQLEAVSFDSKQNKWVASDPSTEGPEAGYNVWGTLLRGGPKPFITRIVSPDTYEQAVLKFMAGDKVDRIEAQANMDIFLENAQDWAYYRMQGLKPDYVTINTQSLVLRLTWSAVVVAAACRAVVAYQTGENFWMFLVQQ